MVKIDQLFKDFLSLFEKVTLPVMLSDHVAEEIKDAKVPIPYPIIQEIMSMYEPDMDEYTEYLPVVRLPDEEQYIALVYWKVSLLKYEFILVTIHPKTMNMISKKSISATIYDGALIKKSVARIDQDRIVHIQAGATLGEGEFEPTHSQSFYMEIMEDGEILFHNDIDNSL